MSAYGTGGVRGLLASCYTFVDEPVDSTALRRAYLRFHRRHPFVRVRQPGDSVIPVPSPKAVVGSNYCDVTALRAGRDGTVIERSA